MKVVAFDGAARPDGGMAGLLRHALAVLEAAGIETELVRLEKNPLTGCYACGECAHKLDDSCSRPADDGLKLCARKLIAADGIIIGSPAYSATSSPATQALMQRLDHAGRANGEPRRRVVAAAIVSGSGPGVVRALESIERRLRAGGMHVLEPGSAIIGAGRGARRGESADGGLEAMAELGRAMARALTTSAT